MAKVQEHCPGEAAPAPGVDHEVIIFGTRTGRSVRVNHGAPLPRALQGLGWCAEEDFPQEGSGFC